MLSHYGALSCDEIPTHLLSGLAASDWWKVGRISLYRQCFSTAAPGPLGRIIPSWGAVLVLMCSSSPHLYPLDARNVSQVRRLQLSPAGETNTSAGS